MPIIVETPATPILTVSEYRSAQKQQQSKANTPHKAVIVATPVFETTPKSSQDQERVARRERDRLGTRMAYLNQKINVQQNQIAQISKMMNLLNNEEFQGSSEEVEAERRLLIASKGIGL